MSLWNRLKVRLGLEDEYEDYDDEYYAEDEEDAPVYRSPYDPGERSVRRVERSPDLDRARGVSYLRGVPGGGRDREEGVPREGRSPAQVRMHIVEPRSFGEAQTIADRFKQGTPVIMNMSGTPADLSKRLLDFASGLTYGLDGGLQKVSEKVFMLTPANVDVSAEDRRRLKDKGLFSID
ncbi:MAG: cell division protein SepF [Coriobacteriia bacterium]|nr:cell division protein SepF [Coriobacteriia bacterium]